MMHRWSLVPATGRDPREPGRTATPLELFFDLVFVVAVSLTSQNLHHFESENHFTTGILRFGIVFFAIWWAWMGFTRFASSFGTDDWLYRLLSLVQMAGVLVFAAGVPRVPRAMNDFDLTITVTGYVIMRLAMACNWLRVAHDSEPHRPVALRYAGGILVVQALWITFIFLPQSLLIPVFFLFAALDLAIPAFAEGRRPVTWHGHHIAERYGLFTIIVLGESILASALAIVHALEAATHYGDLILLAATAFVIVACMWWLYFAYPQGDRLVSNRVNLLWGYGHYAIFAAAAAYSAGIEVAIDYDTHHTRLDAARAALTTCVPVGLFVLAVWLVLARGQCSQRSSVAMLTVAAASIPAAFLPFSLQVIAALMVGLIVVIAREPAVNQDHASPYAHVELTTN
jgi:low temperature requirement protein LtrA